MACVGSEVCFNCDDHPGAVSDFGLASQAIPVASPSSVLSHAFHFCSGRLAQLAACRMDCRKRVLASPVEVQLALSLYFDAISTGQAKC